MIKNFGCWNWNAFEVSIEWNDIENLSKMREKCHMEFYSSNNWIEY